MSKFLITGGAGFIATNLCKKLLEQGHRVIAIDNFITSKGESLRQFEGNPRFTFIKHDITKPFPSTLNSQLSTLNSIYHLACPTGVPNTIKLAEEILQTCSLGTLNVLGLARSTGATVLFSSSSEVYGDPKVFPQTEDYTGNVDPTGIRSPYEEGKRFSESLVSSYVRKYRIDAKIVRVFNTYGPFMSMDDTRVIPRFLKQALNGLPLTVEGKGLQKRTFCYVDNLVSGLLLIMEKGKSGEVYNLGSDKETSIIDLAKLIIKINESKSTVAFVDRPPHDHQRRLPSLEKVKKLGWEFTTDLEEGLRKTLESGFASH